MQIAVWSSTLEGEGTTTLTSILATLIAANHNHKTLLTHTLSSDLSMENYILKPGERDRYGQIGEANIDGLFRLINNGKLEANMVKDYCYSLLAHSNLDFLSADKTYELTDSFINNYMYLLHKANQFYDVVLTDLNVSIDSAIFSKILQETNVLIIVGSANSFRLDELMNKINENKELLKAHDLNIIFTLNKYNVNSNMSVKTLIKPYHIKVPIGIPYSVEIIDNCNRNELIDFVLRQIHSKRNGDFNDYLKKVNQLVKQVISLYQEVPNV